MKIFDMKTGRYEKTSSFKPTGRRAQVPENYDEVIAARRRSGLVREMLTYKEAYTAGHFRECRGSTWVGYFGLDGDDLEHHRMPPSKAARYRSIPLQYETAVGPATDIFVCVRAGVLDD